MSLRASTVRLLIACSGATKSAVPISRRCSLSSSMDQPILASPKSLTLSTPSVRNNRLDGLMSRWMIPR